MNVFDHVIAAGPHVLEQKTQADLLLLHGVAAVIDQHVNVAAGNTHRRPQLVTIRLIGDERPDPFVVELRLRQDVGGEDTRLREVCLPHRQRSAVGDPDFEDRDGLVLPRKEQPLVELGVVVAAGSLVR